MWKFHEIQMNIPITVIFLSGLLSVHAKECSFNVSFITRGKELFNNTNYDEVCVGNIGDYGDIVTNCGPHIINPKCICAYDMYVNGITDLCKNKREAKNQNGSLDHVTVDFCKKYSETKNGPCQNGGELLVTNDLAIHAKCTCKTGFSGEHCDTVTKRVVCFPNNPRLSGFPNCSETFIPSPSNPKCLLSFEAGKSYLCDSQTEASDDLEECKAVPDRLAGDVSKSNCLHSSLVNTITILFMKALWDRL